MTLCKQSNIFIKVITTITSMITVTRNDSNRKYFDMFVIGTNFINYETVVNAVPIFELTVCDDETIILTNFKSVMSTKCLKLALLELFLFYGNVVRNYPSLKFTSKYNKCNPDMKAVNLVEFCGIIGVNLFAHAISLEKDFHFMTNNLDNGHSIANLLSDNDRYDVHCFKYMEPLFEPVLKDTTVQVFNNKCTTCKNNGSSDRYFIDTFSDLVEYVSTSLPYKILIVNNKFAICNESQSIPKEFIHSFMIFTLSTIMFMNTNNIMIYAETDDKYVVTPINYLDFVVSFKLVLPSDADSVNDVKLASKYRSYYLDDVSKDFDLNELVKLFVKYGNVVNTIMNLFTTTKIHL